MTCALFLQSLSLPFSLSHTLTLTYSLSHTLTHSLSHTHSTYIHSFKLSLSLFLPHTVLTHTLLNSLSLSLTHSTYTHSFKLSLSLSLSVRLSLTFLLVLH